LKFADALKSPWNRTVVQTRLCWLTRGTDITISSKGSINTPFFLFQQEKKETHDAV
jgi:hypothetical protein